MDLIKVFNKIKDINHNNEDVEFFISKLLKHLGEDVSYDVVWFSHKNSDECEFYSSEMNSYWLLHYLKNYNRLKNRSICNYTNESWFSSVYLLLVLSNVDGVTFDGDKIKILSEKSPFTKYDTEKLKPYGRIEGLFKKNKNGTG